MEYPSQDRQNCNYAIRYVRWLVDSGRVNQIGPDAFAVLVAVVTMEDQLFYERAPDFWREQLLSRCGIKSVHSLITARQRAIDAGLLFHKQGTKSVPGVYFTMGFRSDSVRNAHRKRTECEQNNATSSPIPKPIPKQESVASLDPVLVGKKKASTPKFDPRQATIPANLDNDAFRKAWSEFIDHRAQVRKPLTKLAADKLLGKASRFGAVNAVLAIENSIENGWAGIFEPKGGTASSSSPRKQVEPMGYGKRKDIS